MSQDTSIPVHDAQPQRDNSDKTADEMGTPVEGNAAASQEAREMKQGEEPSGYRGENPSTAGPGGTAIVSDTPENADGRLNPSAPANTGITPTTTGQ